MDLLQLATRVERLERHNRAMRRMTGVALAGFLLLAGAEVTRTVVEVSAQAQVPRELSAESFVVRDRYGVTRAVLGTSTSSDGRVGSMLTMNGPSGQTGVLVMVAAEGNAVQVMTPGSTSTGAWMSVAADGSALIRARDDGG